MAVDHRNNFDWFREKRAERADRNPQPALTAVQQISAERQANREFWTIRAGFLGASAILSGLEIYLNYVIFSGLAAVVGVAVGLISTGTIVLASFLGRSRNPNIRRTAKASDWIGLIVIASLVSVWWYGTSSIDSAGHQMKEWEGNSATYNAAVGKARADLKSALTDYITCRNRPVASFAREDRAGAVAACEQMPHTAADFPVTVPDPGPRPKESEASVAADWKPAFRGLGILGLAICVLTFGFLISFAQAPSAPIVSPVEQAAPLGQIRVSRLARWPELSRTQFRQSEALAHIRGGRLRQWPVRVGEIFGPFLPNWRTVFCHKVVVLERPFPTPLRMAQSLLKGPSVWFTAPIEKEGKGLEVKDESPTLRNDHAMVEKTTMVADHDSTMVGIRDEKTTTMVVPTVLIEPAKRKTTYICNGEYKLVPRTDGGWKLQTGTKSQDICRLGGEEGDAVIQAASPDQKGTLSDILMKKGKGSILWGKAAGARG